MANNYLQFSFAIDDISDEEREWLDAEDQTNRHSEESIDLDIRVVDSVAYFTAEESGDVEGTAQIVELFLKKFRKKDHVIFEWAETCSKPRPDQFGGGAAIVTADGWTSKNTRQLHSELRSYFDVGVTDE